MDKVRWGIVGPGKIAHQFANDIQYTSNAYITAVASNSKERADSFATKYNIPTAYKGYEALFADPEVDAIYVATTHNFHLENTWQAILAGKAVLCEKPLTDNLTDSQILTNLSRERNVYLMEALWTYFLPTIRKAQEWLEQGRIGKVYNVKANFGYARAFEPKSRLFNPELSGGVLLDMGIYPVSMAWLFMQQDPQDYKIVVEKAPTGVDCDVNAQLIYPDNRVSNLHASFKMKLANNCYIYGEKGYIEIPDFWRSKDVFLYEEENRIDSFHNNRQGLGFEYEIEAASKDILDGKIESEIMSHQYSLKLQEHMDKMIERF